MLMIFFHVVVLELLLTFHPFREMGEGAMRNFVGFVCEIHWWLNAFYLFDRKEQSHRRSNVLGRQNFDFAQI